MQDPQKQFIILQTRYGRSGAVVPITINVEKIIVVSPIVERVGNDKAVCEEGWIRIFHDDTLHGEESNFFDAKADFKEFIRFLGNTRNVAVSEFKQGTALPNLRYDAEKDELTCD